MWVLRWFARLVHALYQRQRLAESQVLDQRTRRTLHDDILPQLHTAMLALSSGMDERSKKAVEMLATAHRQISDLLREVPTTTGSQAARLGIIPALRQVVQNELASRFDNVRWRVDEQAEQRATEISSMAADEANPGRFASPRV